MIPAWIAYAAATYALIAATALFLSWPYAETGEVPKGRIVRDCLFWPIWALIVIVEATEEARRAFRNRVD